MMDVGFGSVIEKFEQHYGSRAAKVLLGLIALAIVAACVAIIWQWLVSPVLTFFKSPERFRLLVQLLYLGLAIGIGTSVARFSARRWTREGRHVREELDQALNRNLRAAEDLQRTAEDLGRMMEENDTRLLVVNKNSTPAHLRQLARQLEEQARKFEAEGRPSGAPATSKAAAEDAPSE
jgi:ABC-type multidrug transport system fused ATPase/permease subunit